MSKNGITEAEWTQAVLRDWQRDFDRIHKPCGTCGHGEAAHTVNGRCKVTGCKNSTAKAHRA
jgi:hypothetical protein